MELSHRITEQDRSAFMGGVLSPDYECGFSLDNQALRYLFIPKRLLDIVPYPERVLMSVDRRDRSSGIWRCAHSLVIYEDNAFYSTLSNENTKKSDYEVSPPMVLDVLLARQDRKEGSPVLFVQDFVDNPVLHGKGIATGFYTRLRECAKLMGFRFIYGLNPPLVRGFFTDKLGRYLLSDLEPNIWEFFSSDKYESLGYLNRMTIDILDPEDVKRFAGEAVENPRERWTKYVLHRVDE